ncbi:MAG: HAD family hydrolase [Candidatus Lokiarchaeota archaeon]|nr:HAD family hydrolase [Candidatus Lokiarchaeota archaeon]
MKIKAVIFDLFGTLIDSFNAQEYRQVLSEMASSLSIPENSFYELWSGSFNQRALGVFKTLEESFNFISRKLNKPIDENGIEKAIRIRKDYTKRTLVPRQDAIDTLKQLIRLGLKIGLISDCTFEVPQMWNTTMLSQHFNSVIFSCSVGIKKPDPKIYHLMCKKLKVKPKNCVYIGDGSSQELSGALQVGMFPILIRSPTEKDSVRYDKDDWDGPKISSLSEILTYFNRRR